MTLGFFDDILRPNRLLSDDEIIGSDANELAFGLLGDDLLSLGAGNDTGFGGAGDDIIVGGADEGELSFAAVSDLGDPFAGQDLPLALAETEVDLFQLANPGDVVALDATDLAGQQEACFFVGDLQQTADGNVIATFLIEGGEGIAGFQQPCFLVADNGISALQIDLEPLVPADNGAFALAVNLGQELNGPYAFTLGFVDDQGAVTTQDVAGPGDITGPSDIAGLPTLEATLGIGDFVEGDVLGGGFGADIFLYDALTDGVDTLLNFQLGIDKIAIAGEQRPCFLPREDGTLIYFEEPTNDGGFLVPDAGMLLEGVDIADVLADPDQLFIEQVPGNVADILI